MADLRVSPGGMICFSADLGDGGPGVRFLASGKSEAVPAFVIRFGGEVRGWRNRCAHREAELDWQPGMFFDAGGRWLICALHAAHYHPLTGQCAGGPCRGGQLQPIPVEERDGIVFRAGASVRAHGDQP